VQGRQVTSTTRYCVLLAADEGRPDRNSIQLHEPFRSYQGQALGQELGRMQCAAAPVRPSQRCPATRCQANEPQGTHESRLRRAPAALQASRSACGSSEPGGRAMAQAPRPSAPALDNRRWSARCYYMHVFPQPRAWLKRARAHICMGPSEGFRAKGDTTTAGVAQQKTLP
jgi:hypothetical protein